MTPNIPPLLQSCYLLLLAATFISVFLVYRIPYKASDSPSKKNALLLLIALWLLQTAFALKGVFLQLDSIPPPFFPAVLTTMAMAVYLALFYTPFQQMDNRLAGITLIQSFRFFLELIFMWLLHEHLLPVQMTFEGRNPDILVGITAPLMAYGLYKNKLPKWALIGWNIAGLILLLNILTVAILSVPTRFQFFTASPGNTIVLHFPYHFIATFLVPLALFSHLISLKILLRKK